MTGHSPFSELVSGQSRQRKARVARKAKALRREMTLAELRQARARTQEDLARELRVGQPAVAKLEHRADMYVSNLRRYIEAMGGKLEITASFPDGDIQITHFTQLGELTEVTNS
jgi:transcriptional regulator with XRE-family HTH domain